MDVQPHQASIAKLIEESNRLVLHSLRIGQAGARTSRQIYELRERSDAAIELSARLKQQWAGHGNLHVAATG